MLAERHNYLGESACSNNSALIAYFVLYTLNNSVQSAGIRVEQTALETVDSIRADYLFRCFKINLRELSSSRGKSVRRDLHARHDESAAVVLLRKPLLQFPCQ